MNSIPQGDVVHAWRETRARDKHARRDALPVYERCSRCGWMWSPRFAFPYRTEPAHPMNRCRGPQSMEPDSTILTS